MLKSIVVENFRRFDRFSLSLREGNILTGPNNCGKSSLVDALRIVDACLKYSRKRNPNTLQLDDGRVVDGFLIPEHRIGVNLINCIHNYNDEDAKIEVVLDNGVKVTVLLSRVRPVRLFVEHDGRRLNSISRMRAALNWQCTIVPTLGALEQDERWVTDETIQKGETTRVSSRHLRNVWFRKSDAEFEKFSEDVSKAWEGIDLKKPERNMGDPNFLEMFFSEKRMDREVHWAGFGFQIWLQILTHLNRASTDQTVIIDEPDVYLHPDIQKTLIRILRSRYSQFIVATHSVELINEAETMEIVSVDPNRRSAKRIRSQEDYEEVYQYIGSSQNSESARVSKSRKVIFVEGKDKKLISLFASKLGFDSLYSGSVPFVELGGFGGWQKAKHAVWALKEILNLEISVYCLFDKDYRCIDEVEAFENRLRDDGIICSVLRRKEIENYMLDIYAIQKAAQKRAIERGKITLKMDTIENCIIEITDQMKERVFAQLREKMDLYIRKENICNADEFVSQKMNVLERDWNQIQRRVEICPGKEIIQRLNDKLQDEGVSPLTPRMILHEIDKNSVDPYLILTLESLNMFCS